MLIETKQIKIPSKRKLSSYAGVNLETYKALYKELKIIENQRLNDLAARPDRQREFGSGGKQLLSTIDDKLLFILHLTDIPHPKFSRSNI